MFDLVEGISLGMLVLAGIGGIVGLLAYGRALERQARERREWERKLLKWCEASPEQRKGRL